MCVVKAGEQRALEPVRGIGLRALQGPTDDQPDAWAVRA
jgi:hypothetical protein